MKSSPALTSASVRRVVGGAVTADSPDVLAVEEPLEIRLGFSDKTHRAISITMRTPGADGELAAGFLFTEGILQRAEQIEQIRHCGLKIGRQTGTLERATALNSNTIRVDLKQGVDVDFKRLERHFYTTSSCGVCGKAALESI
ncbi:MAG: formate dehydrogenase accessory sulfurtransferase FdhD, partial [Acidobacteriota bacterium]